LKPAFFIIGIVKLPVATTLATGLPDMLPKTALPQTAIRAGPPEMRPANALARSIKKSPPPDRCRKAPKTRKGMT